MVGKATLSTLASWLLLAAFPRIAGAGESVCTYDMTDPQLPKASCHFPSCPSGADCQPPVIDRSSAQLELFEPLMKWADSCPDKAIKGSCWEVYTDFKFHLAATDPAGVAAIGVHFANTISSRRVFRRLFAKVDAKDAKGRYEISGTMSSYVPRGQRLEINVYELCARDGLGNEDCVLPARRVAPTAQALP